VDAVHEAVDNDALTFYDVRRLLYAALEVLDAPEGDDE
jgi:hypothetical protein